MHITKNSWIFLAVVLLVIALLLPLIRSCKTDPEPNYNDSVRFHHEEAAKIDSQILLRNDSLAIADSLFNHARELVKDSVSIERTIRHLELILKIKEDIKRRDSLKNLLK